MDPTIKLAPNGCIAVHIPGDRSRGHTVTIPLSLDGVKLLRSILQEREREATPTIGQNGAPTQHQVEAWLRAIRAQRAIEDREREADERERAKAKVADLVPGLDLSTLTL